MSWAVAPQNLEAEESVIGAMMLSPKAIDAVATILGDGTVFYFQKHARIYRAALDLHHRGDPVDPITLGAELERRGELDDVGGRVRIHEIANLVPAASNAAHYARIVHEAARRRVERYAAYALARAASDGGLDNTPELRAMLETLLAAAGSVASGSRIVRGDEFILDTPTDLPAIWGGASGTAVWESGEGFMCVGPDGVGKTTLAQQLVLGLLGLRERVLGMRVAEADRPVLYLALDRPAQARRSFARMVSEDNRERLRERLIIWPGPLPFNVLENAAGLARFIHEQGAGVVVIDSLKDLAPDLTKDETGNRVNSAVQYVLADGVEVLELHHQRKAQPGAPKPTRLADVYGSRWLTAGMGSVALLWGEPGDLVVEFSHLKQPADEVGPFKLLHDHENGETRIVEQVDLLEVALAAGDSGVTADAAAGLMFSTSTPDRNQVEKARRRLEKLVSAELLTRHGEKPHPVTYRRRGTA